MGLCARLHRRQRAELVGYHTLVGFAVGIVHTTRASASANGQKKNLRRFGSCAKPIVRSAKKTSGKRGACI